MNKLLIILILILAIIVIGSMLLVSFLTPKKQISPTPRPVIQASFSPAPYRPPLSSPSPTLTPTTTPASTKTLKLEAISPTEDTNQVYFPIKQISFTFNQPIVPASFVIETTPNVQTIIDLNPNDSRTAIITPQTGWEEGITTITIKDASSTSGNKLDKPVVYKIKTEYPKNPPPDSPGL